MRQGAERVTVATAEGFDTGPINALIDRTAALEPGDASFDEAISRARAAVEVFGVAARERVCPRRLAPVADALSRDLGFLVGTIVVQSFELIEGHLATLHDLALDEYPAMAEVLRGARGLLLVEQHARNHAAGDPTGPESAVQAALDRYMNLVARQLFDRGLLLPGSRILVEDLPALRQRVAALEQRHRDHLEARAAAERSAEECERAERDAQAAAEQAARRAERLRNEDGDARRLRENLSSYYRSHGPAWIFTIAGRQMNGESAANALAAGDEFLPFFRGQWSGKRAAGAR